MPTSPHRHLRRALLGVAAIALMAILLGAPASASAAVPCPNPVPVLHENNCMGAGTTAWRMSDYSESIAAFADQPSVNLGQSVQLKIGRGGGGSANVAVYRMGYYGGAGGRLVHTANGVSIDNPLGCDTPDTTFGRSSCSDWDVSHTIPASALPVSGIYMVKVTDVSTGGQTQAIFVVRDDNRSTPVLFKLPDATYQAYNNWGGKSLYDYNSFGSPTVSGTTRAAKISFDRPYAKLDVQDNWYMKADHALVYWLERQGYDAAYTNNVAVHAAPAELLDHDVLVLSGHDEYWSREEMLGYMNARNAGVSIASFSANTGYWKVRYEDSNATLVAHKTVQGSGSSGSGSAGSNDWGPDKALGTADDALGLDGQAGTADDRPDNSTTTFRDNGAPPGDPNAPSGGRVGPNMPENALFGTMYVGDSDGGSYALDVPAANGSGEFAGDRIWRNTGIAAGSGFTFSGSKYVGWEWDAIPTQAQYLAQQPAGVKRLSDTFTNNGSNWLQDEGRVYSTSPPPGQPGVVSAVKYTAPSGALVFSSGTNQWAWGLGPHWRDQQTPSQTYLGAPFDSTNSRIGQATYNIFADMGVQPGSPTGVVVDGGNQPPEASFTVSPNPALTDQQVTFNASSSSDPGGGIAKYEWDLDGNGSFETDTGTTSTATRSYTSAGTLQVKLRVTDSGGLTGEATRSLAVVAPGGGTGPYANAVLGTQGLVSYWRMGDLTGTSLVDSFGGQHGTLAGAALGAPGALVGDSDTAVSFDGNGASASAPLNLSGTSKATVEFWLKWDAFADNDDLALELTSNFNQTPGGVLVDPNAPQDGGRFGVAIGSGLSRNNAFFQRPSAGAWHHYAFVLDSTAGPTAQIVPYVDGTPVPYTKTATGTGAGAFANSILYFMSRAQTSLFGAGDLDEVAVYGTTLSSATIADHYQKGSGTAPPPNQTPTAAFTPTPNPALTDQTVSFDGSASSDADGTITKYEWDLDGNGTFETDTGTTPTASRSYAAAGTVNVKLRVTDSAGGTGQTAHDVFVVAPGGGTGTYATSVLATSGLLGYWRMGELTGTTLADSRGGNHATVTGASLGAPGALVDDPNTAVSFDGLNDFASAPLNLSGTSKATVEFWLKWDAYASDDDLALELTPNFNQQPGGFIGDPNAPEEGGTFGVAMGNGLSRNNAFFQRPSAGAWHHYALVLDSTAAPTAQIKPYVDGAAVPYTKTATGTGAGAFANSILHLMSRGGSALFGAGDLDELAVYTNTLSPATIADHYQKGSGAEPPPNQAPTASFTATPNPTVPAQQVVFDGSESSDVDGDVTKYEWDLDANGTFETDTGTNPTASRSYSSPGSRAVKLRVTDDDGATAQATRNLAVLPPGGAPGPYASAVLGTQGLVSYWRMGESSGGTLSDSKGTNHGSMSGATPGAEGAVVADGNTAMSFDGTNDFASAPLDLSGSSKATVEFWLKWDAFADNDDLAMELTPNFNETSGGLLVDPNAPQGSTFGVGIGSGAARNNAFFQRPSAGAWHHYAFVLDSTAAASDQVVPYVDGVPVPYSKLSSGTGAGAFANSTLYLMSRAGSALFGSGDLDELAAYNDTLSAATIADHYDKGTTAPANPAPTAAFSMSPNPADTGQQVTFNGSVSSDANGSVERWEWDLDGNGSFETDGGATPTTTKTYAAAGPVTVGLRVTDDQGATAEVTHALTVQAQAPTASFTATPNPVVTGNQASFDAAASSAPGGTITKYEWDLDGNGTFETDTGATATASRTYTAIGPVTVGLRVTRDGGRTAETTRTLTVKAPNQAPTASFTATPNPANEGQTVNFNASGSGDPDGSIAKHEWDLDGNGSYETDTGTTATASRAYTAVGPVTVGLRVTDGENATATTTRSVTVQNVAPTASFTVAPSPAATRQTVTMSGSASADGAGAITTYEWDLDGNGSYETNTGATATAIRVYDIVGTVTVGLRVTDNENTTATTTRSLTVNSAYRTAVLGTAGISDFWRLDDTGTSAVDLNGGNNNGTYTNGPTTIAGLLAGEQNSARAFDGSNDYVNLSATPFGSPAQFSVEAWVRTTATKGSGGSHTVFTDSTSEFNNGVSLVIDSSNRPVFYVARNFLQRGTATSSVTVAPNTTHHIVGTYDGSRVRVYVDGVERANVAFSGGAGWNSGRDLLLGRRVSSSSTQYHLQGTLDEPAIYTQALPAATVLAHYNAGKP
jgi:YD repeat-containing protein